MAVVTSKADAKAPLVIQLSECNVRLPSFDISDIAARRTANDAWWAVALITDQPAAIMGGNKGDRKSYKATSSAKAAEALAAKGAGTAAFGGYVT
jgi:hypothetical protein